MGITPPTMNSARQPYTGPTTPAMVLATKPPSGMQTIVSVTAKGRWRFGTYSDARAAAFGIAPPRPTPAIRRRTPSAATDWTKAIATVNTANATTLPSNAVRRPYRSPSMPPSRPPIIMPKGPVASALRNAAFGTPHSGAMNGTAFGNSWLSTPSRMMVSAVPRMSSFW
nr:hypothetical protein GLBDPPGF_00025 [uncultured bacterium]